ncbi:MULTISPECIES: type VI secretion system protein TssA [Pseudomonas syringae group]|uniref:type VI secretion system protein TssA n=1 Tax=Pseudomonas syringae group TaxID=136849 RepID=UPI0005B6F68B|nr:type VI secretion system protein TssA [Pseudomonas viridiflava]MBD8572404.1 type VI secretion system protein TssA [Pseudomonas syringae]KIQ36024.1 ImpA-like protein [Pseudomonas viridiflava]MEE4094823.1 type VI secretion system protein TssA [Pseudomonas viridiflava]MEE4229575.1 type VI secretion system protein TssA [Pseudomonas viridiflava]MEE4233850.1 type VI secretion system protein TssA [Pseudomonas viridiflava]
MSEFLNDLSLADLTAPINGGSGEDLSFSTLFDQVKEARRADPDYLTQGDWQTDLKSSDWELTITLAAQGLAQQSKDLMLVAWLSEALAHKYHFVGITFGLTLAERILQNFWDDLFPSLEDGVEERAARLAWLKTSLTEVVGGLPITQGQNFGLLRYDESRHVENLALQNPKAMQAAVDEGKINAEIFQRSVVLTDTDHLRLKTTEIAASLYACQQLQATCDSLFGRDAPSFATLSDVLQRGGQLTEKLLKDRGIELTPAPPAQAETAPATAADQPAGVVMTQTSQDTTSAPLRTTPATRDEAFTMLASVAQFFKNTEPQSPVPYLIERAIKWGNMPLEGWLNDVIKDSNVVDSIRDVLGTKEPKQ